MIMGEAAGNEPGFLEMLVFSPCSQVLFLESLAIVSKGVQALMQEKHSGW